MGSVVPGTLDCVIRMLAWPDVSIFNQTDPDSHLAAAVTNISSLPGPE